jgi:hypothetical protein
MIGDGLAQPSHMGFFGLGDGQQAVPETAIRRTIRQAAVEIIGLVFDAQGQLQYIEADIGADGPEAL